MPRITRAQIIQLYQFAPLEEVLEFHRDATSACQIVLEQQGIHHPDLNPLPIPEPEPETIEVVDGDPGPITTGAEEPLPEEFPSANALIAGGITTKEAVRAASDEDLLKISGIGQAALKKIRDAQ